MNLTLKEAARIMGGSLAQAPESSKIEGVGSIDTRTLHAGDLFFAIRGKHLDGHDFLQNAFEKGASAAVVTREVEGAGAQIVVADSSRAVKALAGWVRDTVNPVVVGITGSTGKTSVKDLLAAISGRVRPTVASQGSFNNELGLPLTLLKIKPDTEVVVCEMGARGPGQIKELCELARPHIGVVTNIGVAHFETFGSQDAIAAAKAELIQALPEGGAAVLNADDPRVAAMASVGSASLTYGLNPASWLRAESVTIDKLGRPTFRMVKGLDKEWVSLNASGQHQVHNSLAASAAALALGITLEDCRIGLEAAEISAWRMETTEVRGVVIVNDAYNANPTSVNSALTTCAAMVPEGGRMVAVLGYMAELGALEDFEHRQVGALAASTAQRLVVVGGKAQGIAAGALNAGHQEVVSIGDAEAADVAIGELASGDVVLIKGSRVAALEDVARRGREVEPGMINILIAAAVSFLLVLVGTPMGIRMLRRRGIGQFVREDGPKAHFVKKGTPTMGGVVIILGAVVGYFAAHLRPSGISKFSTSGLLAISTIVAMAILGFADDYLKNSKKRSLGLSKTAKFLGQALIAIGFVAAVPHTQAASQISFVRPLGVGLGIFFALWIFLIIAAAANGANLADGLDGLACGSGAMVMGAYVIIAFWQVRHLCGVPSAGPGCYDAKASGDLALVAASMLGATAAFLWWNAAPAKIFMGDTGSLALGGAMASLAILTNTQLLLIVLGGLYVVEVSSVVLQVISFRIFGKRLFLMAPIHHHFELLGWPEFTVIVRFWVLAALAVAFGLGLFYGEFLNLGGGEAG